jgi:hypothetical protein
MGALSFLLQFILISNAIDAIEWFRFYTTYGHVGFIAFSAMRLFTK